MKTRFTLAVLCLPFLALSQSGGTYYDHNTRYGTFRHYSAGGSKLISGTDYAAQMAEAQRQTEAARAAREERARYERNQAASQSSTPSNNGRASNASKPFDSEAFYRAEEQKAQQRIAQYKAAAAQKEAEKGAYYQQEKARFEAAKDLREQVSYLGAMQRTFPSDAQALTLFGLHARIGSVADAKDVDSKNFTDALRAKHADLIAAGYGEAYYRSAQFADAATYLARVKAQDSNSLAQLISSQLRLQSWKNALETLGSRPTNAQDALLPIREDLRAAIELLAKAKGPTHESDAVAQRLYSYATARRMRGSIDFVNVLALNAAIALSPAQDSYREERYNTNGILDDTRAMREDADYFSSK